MLNLDKTCLSYWFPRLQTTGVPTPKTVIVHPDCDLDPLLDGMMPDRFDEFLDLLKSAIEEVGGYPCFLRTGHTSAKHGWKETCYLEKPENLSNHVAAIVEYSALADLVCGLPIDVWVVRELLETDPVFHAFHGEMPVTKERRYFVRDGKVEHRQPYWPPPAIKEASCTLWRELLAMENEQDEAEVQTLTELSERVGSVIEGYWSVDWLWTIDRGWVCIDMAEGEKSFRWEPE